MLLCAHVRTIARSFLHIPLFKEIQVNTNDIMGKN